MHKYRITSDNGDTHTARSMKAAIATARRELGVTRVYRGAQYRTDRPGTEGERERVYCTGLDIWRTRAEATRQSNACAPVVISTDGDVEL